MDYSSYEICRLVEAIDKVTNYIDWNIECTLDDDIRNSTVEGLRQAKEELLSRL